MRAFKRSTIILSIVLLLVASALFFIACGTDLPPLQEAKKPTQEQDAVGDTSLSEDAEEQDGEGAMQENAESQGSESIEGSEGGENVQGGSGEEGGQTSNDEAVIARCAECHAPLTADSSHATTCPKYADIPAESRVFDLLNGIKGMREKYNDRLVISDQAEEYFLTFNYLDASDYAAFLLWLCDQTLPYWEVKAEEEIYRVATEVGDMVFTLSFNNVIGEDYDTINLRVSGTPKEEE